jgi:hypothetical protein
MSDIVVITPPDILYNNVFKVLLVNPSPEIKNDMQDLLTDYPVDMNIYIYDHVPPEEEPAWLIQVAEQADLIVVNIPNCFGETKQLVTYLLGKNKTFYLTMHDGIPYNMLCRNEITSIKEISNHLLRGYNEQTSEA